MMKNKIILLCLGILGIALTCVGAQAPQKSKIVQKVELKWVGMFDENARYTIKLLKVSGTQKTVLGLIEASYCTETNIGSVDYIKTEKAERGKGYGDRLFRAAIAHLYEKHSAKMNKITLTAKPIEDQWSLESCNRLIRSYEKKGAKMVKLDEVENCAKMEFPLDLAYTMSLHKVLNKQKFKFSCSML